MDSLEQRIKRLREAQGLSQQAVADKVGVSRVAVTKWENGATANLKLVNLLSLCDLFDVSVEELVRGSAAPQPQQAEGGDMNKRKPSALPDDMRAIGEERVKEIVESAARDGAQIDRLISVGHRYLAAEHSIQEVVDFLLQDEDEQRPPWVDSDASAYADSLEAKAHKWITKGKSGIDTQTGT
ncbi:helix-turn-helix transcriptional regulator [Halomonas venusta]|uniref:helix-turn-helix domain-containing protein n=1 Tax=Vreelandella venusta TaxID=44935 RepID=UPI00295F0938|nr:helix-turn-helix transcriptional regulator [Halomonas venusta]MDW0357770.1 helix-turn-helix transcriptional regulator [Halomonas venusta]